MENETENINEVTTTEKDPFAIEVKAAGGYIDKDHFLNRQVRCKLEDIKLMDDHFRPGKQKIVGIWSVEDKPLPVYITFTDGMKVQVKNLTGIGTLNHPDVLNKVYILSAEHKEKSENYNAGTTINILDIEK